MTTTTFKQLWMLCLGFFLGIILLSVFPWLSPLPDQTFAQRFEEWTMLPVFIGAAWILAKASRR